MTNTNEETDVVNNETEVTKKEENKYKQGRARKVNESNIYSKI